MSVPRGTQEHREDAQRYASIRAAVLTVSDSRTTATDESGPLIRELLTSGLHTITQAGLLPNDEESVRGTVVTWLGREDVDAIIITGGTGLGSRDRSIEAVRPLFDKEIPGFGELFRLLSFQEQIGSSSILSRATAGSARGKVVVVLPGSRAAVELAMQRIILPELPHLLREIRR